MYQLHIEVVLSTVKMTPPHKAASTILKITSENITLSQQGFPDNTTAAICQVKGLVRFVFVCININQGVRSPG
jgi:hypothetical protein